MRILLLGGDGYLGWPTAMRFSNRGHEIHVVDDYLRRRAHAEAGTDSLTPILPGLPERVDAWKDVTGKEISYTEGDLCDWSVTERVFREFQPDAVVHYGEMPSAPYSMKDREHAVFTQTNNVVGTLNVLFAIERFAPDCHLVKLGTMGEYGTPNIDIEEGFITIDHKGRSDTLPFPKVPGSYYHLSKVHDSHNIQFACRVRGAPRDRSQPRGRLRHRDRRDQARRPLGDAFRLRRRVRHRAQPLLRAGGDRPSAHGLRQGRTDAWVPEHRRHAAMRGARRRHPAEAGEFRVFNQFTEQFSVVQLAEHVQKAGAEVGMNVTVDPIDNPRVEMEEHYYHATHTKLLDLGLEPHLLSDTLIESMFSAIDRHKGRVILDHILPRDRWRPGVGAPST